jgi:hypothetical protein
VGDKGHTPASSSWIVEPGDVAAALGTKSHTQHMTAVLIPGRNTALELERLAAFGLLSFAINHDENHHDDSASSSGCLISMLSLQCHSEGAFWRGLVPLLSQHDVTDENDVINTWKRALLAMAVLVTHYEECIYSIRRDNLTSERTSKCDKQTSSEKYHQTHELLHCGTPKQITAHHVSDWLIVSFPNNTPININRKSQHLIITIYPPNPIHKNICYSRTPSSRPTNTFTLGLIAYENCQIRLQSVSAYLSTLGGGYFLCHHLSTALLMAKKQCEVAQLRGDEDMVRVCETSSFLHYLSLSSHCCILISL